MRIFLQTLSAVIVMLIAYTAGIKDGNSKNDGSPLGTTGSPGDGANNTCAKFGCHVGTVNAFPGSVSIDASSIPANGYEPGATYSLTVTVAESGRSTYGFQMTAEDNSQNKMGTYTSNTAVRLESQNWVTHRLKNSSGVFTFDWTAPMSSEDITFYAAGNAANGNNHSSGDHIYTGSTTVVRDPIAASIVEVSPNMDKIYFNSESKSLIINTINETSIKFYSINGALISELNVSKGHNSILTSSFDSGIYILLESKTGFSYKFVVS